MAELYAWLYRMDYKPYFSGIRLNNDCPNLTIKGALKAAIPPPVGRAAAPGAENGGIPVRLRLHRDRLRFPETRVVDVRPLAGGDGSGGYEVTTVRSTAWFSRRRRFTCRSVVFAASALGAMDLLFRLKADGSLPAISGRLGDYVRTNCESLIGIRIPGNGEDLSKGIAIGSGFYRSERRRLCHRRLTRSGWCG